ncbi:hypothetical protein BKA70DRAFT_1419116 [Coprinopsis sp. MPI-PUGE-AT-0042]|nr:hypothetical protein BKA70DRAFT_1419116 [Coprinopsis sp. MPI-PUGE-AT-0042]
MEEWPIFTGVKAAGTGFKVDAEGMGIPSSSVSLVKELAELCKAAVYEHSLIAQASTEVFTHMLRYYNPYLDLTAKQRQGNHCIIQDFIEADAHSEQERENLHKLWGVFADCLDCSESNNQKIKAMPLAKINGFKEGCQDEAKKQKGTLFFWDKKQEKKALSRANTGEMLTGTLEEKRSAVDGLTKMKPTYIVKAMHTLVAAELQEDAVLPSKIQVELRGGHRYEDSVHHMSRLPGWVSDPDSGGPEYGLPLLDPVTNLKLLVGLSSTIISRLEKLFARFYIRKRYTKRYTKLQPQNPYPTCTLSKTMSTSSGCQVKLTKVQHNISNPTVYTKGTCGPKKASTAAKKPVTNKRRHVEVEEVKVDDAVDNDELPELVEVSNNEDIEMDDREDQEETTTRTWKWVQVYLTAGLKAAIYAIFEYFTLPQGLVQTPAKVQQDSSLSCSANFCENNFRKCLMFKCAAGHCYNTKGHNICCYLDTGNANSTSNLWKHASKCWGEDAVKVVKAVPDAASVCKLGILASGQLSNAIDIMLTTRPAKVQQAVTVPEDDTHVGLPHLLEKGGCNAAKLFASL